MRFGKRVGCTLAWIDKDRSMDSGSFPGTMGMPPYGTFLNRKNHLLPEFPSRLDGALSDVFRAI